MRKYKRSTKVYKLSTLDGQQCDNMEYVKVEKFDEQLFFK